MGVLLSVEVYRCAECGRFMAVCPAPSMERVDKVSDELWCMPCYNMSNWNTKEEDKQ